MIILGAAIVEKAACIERYVALHAVRKVVIICPVKFRFPVAVEAQWVDWPEVIQYKTYFPLLQTIDKDTLVVVAECLRTKNRYELTYNCIRLYLAQAGHRLIFQHLPFIEDMEDFAILFDFETGSRWKRSPMKDLPLNEAQMEIVRVPLALRSVPVETDAKTKAAYARERERLFAEVEASHTDPHTLPRNLYLIGGKAKLAHVQEGRAYLGRNNRFGLPSLRTYKEDTYPGGPWTIFELPHNHIDFADVVCLTGQSSFDVLVADLKADAWYVERFTSWAKRLADGYAALQR